MKIAIDAGHGPNTAGKRCPDDSMREYHFNSVVARYLAAELVLFDGVEILTTFEDKRDVPLQERTDKANAWCADVFISIHANASGGDWNDAQGIETFVYAPRPAPAVTLANAVQRNLIRKTKLHDRGVLSADFHVLRETRMTAILCECGFMTNRQEAELLKSDPYRHTCAAAIADGIIETYGLKQKEKPKDPSMVIKKEAAQKVIDVLGAVYTASADKDVQAAAHYAADTLRNKAGIPK